MRTRIYGKHAKNLFLFLTTLLGVCGAQAQTESRLEDMSLEELLNVKVVSATRSESNAIQLPAVVTVVTAEELTAWGASNLAEGLRQVSGVVVRRSPGDFPQYEVSIRGNTADFMNTRTLFLIDGVPIHNSSGGLDPSWIPISMVKRLEIVKGAVSALYGANAFGGVINIITKSGDDEQANQGKVGGSVRKDAVSGKGIPGLTLGLSAGEEGKNWNYFAAANVDRENDSPVNYSGQTYQGLFGKASHHLTDQTSITLTGLTSFDQNQIGSSNSPDPINNSVSHVAATVQTQISERSQVQVTGYLDSFNHFLKYSDAITNYENRSQTVGMMSQYSILLGGHSVVMGLEAFQDSGSLDTKEKNYATNTIQNVGWGTRYQNTYGVFLQDEYKGWKNWSPLIGLRYDENSAFGNAVSPRAALGYSLREGLNLFVSLGTGFRAPNFNESYIHGYGKVGNENLRPELTTTYEVGVKSVGESAQNTVALFKQDVSRKVELRKVNASDPNSLNTFDNTGTASIYGAEFEGSGRISQDFKIFYNATLLKTDDGNGDRILKVVEQTALLGANFLMGNWALRPAVFYQGDQKMLDTLSNQVVNVPGFATVNLQGVRKWEKSALTLYLNNLTDQKYREGYSPFISRDAAWLPGINFGANWGFNF